MSKRREELAKFFMLAFQRGKPKDGEELHLFVASCASLAVHMQETLDKVGFEAPSREEVLATVKESLKKKYGAAFEDAVISGALGGEMCDCETCKAERKEQAT